jgi:hypothetical protein
MQAECFTTTRPKSFLQRAPAKNAAFCEAPGLQGMAERAERVRGFSRFYTREIGVLHEHLLQSEFSLTEVRVLYELAHRAEVRAADLVRHLDLMPAI